MSMAKKVLFRTSDAGPDIEGLIECLKKTSPGGMQELSDRGGRLNGQRMASDPDISTDPNVSRRMTPLPQEG